LTDETVFAALDQTMVNAGLTWCQRCQVLALHVSGNASDQLDPISLLKLCYRGSSTNSDGDPSLMSWQLPAVTSSSAPDPALRLDAYSCQTCPPTLSPDMNGQCTVQCPADVVINGYSEPLGTTTWETTYSQLPGGTDTCPGVFIIEILHPDQFFVRGGASIGASDSVDSPSSPNCAQSFSLTFADSPPPGSTYVNENTISGTGSYTPGGGGPDGSIQSSPGCLNVPALALAETQLTYGSDPIQFITTATSGVSFVLSVPTKAGGPR